MASGTSTPRSRSRSKRSTTNLANLRLAPLSTKYEASKGEGPPLKSPLRTPYEPESEAEYVRRHPSYLQGQSAPTTPGILSRSNSKRHLGGGLSRRGSLYDEGEDADAENEIPIYASSGPGRESLRPDVGTGHIPKAKSEAALSRDRDARKAAHRLTGPGVPLASQRTSINHNNRYNPRGRRSGAATPTQRRQDTSSLVSVSDDSWLTHTGAMTSALVREDKGQSWIATRQSSTSLAPPTDSEDEEYEDNYEEMAALAASTAKMQQRGLGSYGSYDYGGYEGGSPVSTRQSRSAWGSRYGSRPASNRASRLGSPVGMRTPRKTSDQMAGYFEQAAENSSGFVRDDGKRDEETADDEKAIARLSKEEGFGLGNVVDRVMNFNLFGGGPQDTETTDDDDEKGKPLMQNVTTATTNNDNASDRGETAEEAQKRMEAEKERRREEKGKLTKQQHVPAPLSGGKGGDADGAGGEVSAGWQDASWLLSVAAKALF